MYGAPASIKVIEHYRELIYDYILDYSYQLHYREMVYQLLEYSDERKKDFDIVAAYTYKEACELLEENDDYFVALLDLNLPDAPDGEGNDHGGAPDLTRPAAQPT